MKRIKWFVLAVLAIQTTAQAASFDCSKASSNVEKIVCDTPSLSELDDELGTSYEEATHLANDEQQNRLETDQKYWLKHARNQCADVTCIKQAYQTRLAYLQNPLSKVNHSIEEMLFKKSIASILKLEKPTSFAVLDETLTPDDLVYVSVPGYYSPQYALKNVSRGLTSVIIDTNSWINHDEGIPLMRDGSKFDFGDTRGDNKIAYLGIINHDQFSVEQERQTQNGSGYLMIAKFALPAIKGNKALVYLETKYIFPKHDPDLGGRAYGVLFKKEQDDWQLVKCVVLYGGILNSLRIPARTESYSAQVDEVNKPIPTQSFRDCSDCSEMVAIPKGSFDMGKDWDKHHVDITESFAIGKYEVTQAEWQAVMGSNPSKFANCGGDCPVEQVSWNDIQVFIQKLNQKTGKYYRLPTEAEWEYACRAGSRQKYCGSDDLDAVAWYGVGLKRDAAILARVGQGPKTWPVGQKQANNFGLYDMTGNVAEWVEDMFDSEHSYRVLRGGTWRVRFYDLGASERMRSEPNFRSSDCGFRLARALP